MVAGGEEFKAQFKGTFRGDWKLSRQEAKTYFEKDGKQIHIDGLWKDEDKDGDGFVTKSVN